MTELEQLQNAAKIFWEDYEPDPTEWNEWMQFAAAFAVATKNDPVITRLSSNSQPPSQGRTT